MITSSDNVSTNRRGTEYTAQHLDPRPRAACLLAMLGLLIVPPALAQAAGQRVALVIGNARYEANPLANPVNDARDLAGALREVGFDKVIERTDLTKDEMRRAVLEFGGDLQGAEAGVFYYSGHGMQIDGKNYLIPLGVQANSEPEMKIEAVDLDEILARLAGAQTQVNVVILDACRDNPFRRLTRGGARGLANVDAPEGTLIAYATSPGKTADDGRGRNGTYTAALLDTIREPGLPIESMFKAVRAKVKSQTGGKQLPWEVSSLTGEFSFRPRPGNAQASASNAAPTGSALPSPPPAEALTGGLQVLVNAPGAKVYLDGELRGEASPKSALNIPDIPIGEVRVTVEADGYARAEQAQTITQGKWTKAKLVLDKRLVAVPQTQTAAHPAQGGALDTQVATANIGAGNSRENSALLTPSLLWLAGRGANLRVTSYRGVLLPAALRAATQKYGGTASVSRGDWNPSNYVAGLPFARVETTDSDAAAKIMMNYDAAGGADDIDIRTIECDTGTLGKDPAPLHLERHFQLDHFRRMYFTGRLAVNPKPAITSNRDSIRYKEAIYPMSAPDDLRGTGFTMNRYLHSSKQDDSWLYLPQLRRVRRLSAAQRSDALFGQDTDMDSYAGFSGNPAFFDWRVLGEKTVLGSFHAATIPIQWAEPPADFLAAGAWEPRSVWVVEASPQLDNYAYSKRILYVDQETFRIVHSDIYDRAGELWKSWINQFAQSSSRAGEFIFLPAVSLIDMQLQHATKCALPGSRQGAEAWVIDQGQQGGGNEALYELSAVIAAGR